MSLPNSFYLIYPNAQTMLLIKTIKQPKNRPSNNSSSKLGLAIIMIPIIEIISKIRLINLNYSFKIITPNSYDHNPVVEYITITSFKLR